MQEPEQLTHSILETRQNDKMCETKGGSSHGGSVMEKTKRLNKNNSVYMGVNREAEGQREERNRIYVGDKNQIQ